MSLTALGVVYGDIGTSPLYAIRECFKPAYGLLADVPTVYGVLSLIVWALIAIVSVKYVVFIMRLDKPGRGRILALLALVLRFRRLHFVARRRWRWSRLRAGSLVGAFLAIDLAFLAANLVKIEHGGWVPVVLACGVFSGS